MDGGTGIKGMNRGRGRAAPSPSRTLRPERESSAPDRLDQGRLPELSPQYYHVNQGPTYTGPGNYAPMPTYRENAQYGWGYGGGIGWRHGWYGGAWGWDYPYVYQEGVIGVDIYDGKSKQALWHASVDQNLVGATGDKADKKIRDAVAAIFTKYPR